jgi:hypothetical protein
MIDRHAIRQRWEADGSKRDERGRRLFAASEARAAGWGGLAAVSNITGLARSTIERGLKDLDAPPLAGGQVRRKKHLDIRGDTFHPEWNYSVSPRNRSGYRCPHPKKKLTGSDVAANSSCWWCRKHGSGGERLDLHDVAKVGQTFDQTFLLGGTAIEVIAAEVLVHRPILEHVVDRGKDGRDDGHNRLLGAAPGFDAVKLSL